MTPYHSQFWAHALTLKGVGGSIESLSRSISNARVDLNPHQVEAALWLVFGGHSHVLSSANAHRLGRFRWSLHEATSVRATPDSAPTRSSPGADEDAVVSHARVRFEGGFPCENCAISGLKVELKSVMFPLASNAIC